MKLSDFEKVIMFFAKLINNVINGLIKQTPLAPFEFACIWHPMLTFYEHTTVFHHLRIQGRQVHFDVTFKDYFLEWFKASLLNALTLGFYKMEMMWVLSRTNPALGTTAWNRMNDKVM